MIAVSFHISLAAEKQQPKPPVSPLENSDALHAAHAGREWLRSIGLDYNSEVSLETGWPKLDFERKGWFVSVLRVSIRGCSSAGRAPDLHSGGRRFDPDQLHQFCENQYLIGPIAQLARAHP